MPRIETFVCDAPGCGKQKGETNRWWQIFEAGGVWEIRPLEKRLQPDAKVVCGQECAQKMLARFLSREGKENERT